MARTGAQINIPETSLEQAKRERRIARAYQSGVEIADIKRMHKISDVEIRAIARKYGVPLRMPAKAHRRLS